MKKYALARRLAVVSGLAVASGGAMATGCDQVYSTLQGYMGISLSFYQSQLPFYLQSYPQCFGSSSTAAPAQQISATSLNLLSAISQNLGSRLLAGGGPTRTASLASGTGLAAGGAAGAWNGWASYSGDNSSYKVSRLTVNGVANNIDNQNMVDNLVLGGDYRIAPAMVLGLSAAFDSGNGYVNPNTLVLNGRTSTSSRGQSLAAYVGWQVDRNWAVDATVGLGTGTSSPAPLTTADSKRRFAGLNLSYAHWIGNWQLNGKAGYQFGAEEFDNIRRGVTLPQTFYTARLGQVKVGGEVGYWMADGVMPFIGVSYVNDVSRNRVRVPQLWDEDAIVVSAGINFFSLKNKLSGGIVYTDETSRSFVGHSNWMANINYRF